MKLFKRSSAILLAFLMVLGATAISVGQVAEFGTLFASVDGRADSGAAVQGDSVALQQDAAVPAKKAAVQKADAQVAAPACNCGKSPTIIIHGIGQSDTYVYENGQKKLDADGKPIASWPISADVNAILPKLLLPLVSSLFAQSDKGLSKGAYDVAGQILDLNRTGLDARSIYDIRVENFPYPFSQYTKEEADFVYGKMPMQDLAAAIGEDHMFYFAYDSFGNTMDIAKDLHDFVQLVKDTTGHSKVNIMPISLGGTVMNSFVEMYKNEGMFNDLDTVVYIVPALDGSALMGDLYNARLSTNDEMLYRELFPSLVGGYTGYLLNLVIRLLPKQVVLDMLDGLLDGVFDNTLRGCTNLWALVPQADYPSARERLLSDPKYAEIARQTDWYYNAQKNSRANVLAMQAAGVKVYDVVDYNYPLLTLTPSGFNLNGDGLIHVDSASMGATSGNYNTPLGADYEQAACKNHNHISPDGIVDASTGLLPDYTFYFGDQDHERTGRNDVIMKLATALCQQTSYQTVFELESEGFPQFNKGRDTRGLRTGIIPKAKDLLATADLSAENRAELEAALAEGEALMANTVVVSGETDRVVKRLDTIIAKIEGRSIGSEEKSFDFEAILETLTKLLSDALYQYLGPRGFSDLFKK